MSSTFNRSVDQRFWSARIDRWHRLMSTDGAGEHVWLTNRLGLRRPTCGDVDVVLCLHQDPRSIAHNPADGLDHREQAAALVQRWLRHWEDHDIGYCVVQWRCDVEVLGVCGVKVIDRASRHRLTDSRLPIVRVEGGGSATIRVTG